MNADVTHIAVLTGDLRRSTALPPKTVESIFTILDAVAMMAREWPVHTIKTSRHRGDGWQMAISPANYAPRLAVVIKAELKRLDENFDTYIAIADGPDDTELPRDLNEATSEPFVNSGRFLDGLKRVSPERTMGYAQGGYKDATLQLLDNIISGWTQSQASAIRYFLDTEHTITHAGAAKLLGKSRQAVGKSLDAAKHNLITSVLDSIEGNQVRYEALNA